MKKTFIAVCVALFISWPFVSSGQSRIGYISPDEIFSVLPDTRKADSSLQQFQIALQQVYTEQENELNAALEKFVRDSSKMTPAVKEAKRTELQNRISELQKKQEQLNNAVEMEKEKQLKPIRDKIMAAIKTVAGELGYDHVFYKESVIVFPDANDITNAVKKKLGIRN